MTTRSQVSVATVTLLVALSAGVPLAAAERSVPVTVEYYDVSGKSARAEKTGIARRSSA